MAVCGDPGFEHQWINVPEGSPLTDGVPFKFCFWCDEEVWDDGTVRPGCLPAKPSDRVDGFSDMRD